MKWLMRIMLFPIMAVQSQMMVGQITDEHNCVTDGGYQWCESRQECVRPWVTPCVDGCSSNPCMNGGMCNGQSSGYTCLCTSGYTGVNCERSIFDSSSAPVAPAPSVPVAVAPSVPVPVAPSVPVPVAPSVPADCISWNDGCNTCSVVNGQIGGCTMMMCFSSGTPHCVRYSQTNNQLSLGDVCYRFCEDGSEPSVSRTQDCPVGTTCTAPNVLGFDSCGTSAHTCMIGH